MSANERTSVRGATLTDTNIAELEPLLRPYRVRVGAGLYLEVTPDARKIFIASWLCPRSNRNKSRRLGPWGEEITLAAARQLADELRAEARSYEHSSTKPVKGSAEYQRDKRLRQAARKEIVKNFTFHKRFLSWPAP